MTAVHRLSFDLIVNSVDVKDDLTPFLDLLALDGGGCWLGSGIRRYAGLTFTNPFASGVKTAPGVSSEGRFAW